MAHVVAVNASLRRCDPKMNLGAAEFRVEHGLVGDSHAGLNERQVSLLALESIEEANREHHIQAEPGSFAENLTTSGFDLLKLKIGDRISVGPVLLEVVQLGKPLDVSHTYAYQGVSILPRRGVFCRVLRGGRIVQGDAVMLAPEEKP